MLRLMGKKKFTILCQKFYLDLFVIYMYVEIPIGTQCQESVTVQLSILIATFEHLLEDLDYHPLSYLMLLQPLGLSLYRKQLSSDPIPVIRSKHCHEFHQDNNPKPGSLTEA